MPLSCRLHRDTLAGVSLPVTEVSAGATPLPRFVARVTGEAAPTFLQDTTTQELLGLTPGTGALTCFLDEKGRILAEMRVVVAPDGSIMLDGEEAAREAILERLARIAPLSGVEVTDAGLAVTAVRGLNEPALPPVQHASIANDGALLVRAGDGYDVIGDAPDLPRVSFEKYEHDRILAGRARFGTDIAVGTLINETPLMATAVALDKGCYPGQESVAKVRNLGSIRRRLVLVRAAHDLPAAPVPLTLDGADAGVVTSTAATVGIATARADLSPGQRLDAGGIPAVLERAL
jgi:folate-binding protein YgfZ